MSGSQLGEVMYGLFTVIHSQRIALSQRFKTKNQAETTADKNNRVNRLQGEIEREAGVS
jgi:hypothetical protein